jgi:hypothetical protein
LNAKPLAAAARASIDLVYGGIAPGAAMMTAAALPAAISSALTGVRFKRVFVSSE